MVHVDFTGLHERKCVDSDFEEWQMVGPSQLCVLGHEVWAHEEMINFIFRFCFFTVHILATQAIVGLLH